MSAGGDWRADVFDEGTLKRQMTSIVEAHRELHKKVAQRVEKNRDLKRRMSRKGQLPDVVVGDYVLVARVSRSETTPKLVSMWTEPWRILTAEQSHVYGVRRIVTGQVQNVHVAFEFTKTRP